MRTSLSRNRWWFLLVVFAATFPPRVPADDAPQLAAQILQQAGIQRGVCAIVAHDGWGTTPIDIARQSDLFVHVRFAEDAAARRMLQVAQQSGLSIDRFSADSGNLKSLPYADNLIDVLIVPGWSENVEALPSHAEMLRVLRPRGKALVGGVSAFETLQRSSQGSDDLKSVTVADDQWSTFLKPPLAGAGEWSHWEHGPDNNPVSEDQIIKAPYLTQYLAHPYYIAMPSITTAAGGRTFLAIGHIAHHEREWNMMTKLIASNGYNGTILWERDLPAGYMVHRSAFIAQPDAFYMIDGERALILDPETGAERGEIRIPEVQGDWKWMVMQDGVLFVLAGRPDAPAEEVRGDRSFGGWSWADLSQGYYEQPHVPWGFGHTLAAWDLDAGRVLWIHREDEQPIDSRALSMGEDRITVYCPDRYFRCLDLKTGEVLWTNDDAEMLKLIEQPGQKLTSTPGFRTMCTTLFTPEALIIQGQTRNNVVALSTADGYLLWTKQKVTNNPNAIYLDGKVILGVGAGGSHVAVDPVSGEVEQDLKFIKRACTRLTACSDSLFVRGEGTLRFDRETGEVQIDGAARPACNDGALPANGLLYVGPWQCDCNLSLIGRLARCSAGDFRFDYEATSADRLIRQAGADAIAPFEITDQDWPTYRRDLARSGSTEVAVNGNSRTLWQTAAPFAAAPTAPVAAGGLIFVAGDDGLVRAISDYNGQTAWSFATGSPIKAAPTVADGRVYIGSGDGQAYCLEAASGRELWRFRAAPIERHTMIYGHMASTWPVNSGILITQDANSGRPLAVFAAGIIDSDGTYVYAVDAHTGEVVWQNNSSGHHNAHLRKGVSVQGNLALDGDRLLLAGGNQISPAPFDLKTGECLADPFPQGQPKANNGRFAGLFAGKYPIVGGRVLYSAAENVSTKGSFTISTEKRGDLTLSFGGIPPAWDDDIVALVNFQNGKLTAMEADKVAARIDQGFGDSNPGEDWRQRTNLADRLVADGAVRWSSDLGEPNKFEVSAIALCPNAVVAAFQQQEKARSQPTWYVAALDKSQGRLLWRQPLPGEPLPDGLLVDRHGHVVVTLVNGDILCLGQPG